MAYYYITEDYKVFKTVGARKVKMIYGSRKKFRGHKGNEFFEDIINAPNSKSYTIPQIQIQMTTLPIGVQARKLKAKWTIEVEQDIKVSGIDIDSALRPWLKERPFRNTIPIHKFKAKYNIRLETKNYYDVIFEMIEKDLTPTGFSGGNSAMGAI